MTVAPVVDGPEDADELPTVDVVGAAAVVVVITCVVALVAAVLGVVDLKPYDCRLGVEGRRIVVDVEVIGVEVEEIAAVVVVIDVEVVDA